VACRCNPRGVLIRTRELPPRWCGRCEDRPVVLLRAHGLTSTGTSVPEAVLRAVSIDTLARLSLTLTRVRRTLVDLPARDLAELPDLGGGFNLDTAGATSWPACLSVRTDRTGWSTWPRWHLRATGTRSGPGVLTRT